MRSLASVSFAVLAILVMLLPLLGARPARTCMNETILELDELAPQVARAKKALERGDYETAGKAIAGALPALQARASHYKDAGPLLRRARTLSLAATIRSNGRVAGKTIVEDEGERLQMMLDAYQGLVKLKGKKKAVDELEAEVMARADNMRPQAKARLEELSQKDLLASPEAWAALAILRAHEQDAPGAKLAQKICAQRAINPWQCAGFRVEAPGRS